MRIDETRTKILTRHELLASGIRESQLKRSLRDGRLRRLHTGAFVTRQDWESARAEERHLLAVLAADRARKGGDVVFSHASAAVAWGLPLFRMPPSPVHTSGPRTDGVVRPKAGLAHHAVAVDDEDRVVIAGLPCTSLERTVYDMIRTQSKEAAVALADAAMRLVAAGSRRGRYDDDAADAWRASLLGRIARSVGARGIRQARWLARFADGRAELPGESVSRLYLVELGFAAPRLQVPFDGPNGEQWLIDFGLDDVGAWGEFDGVGKYTDPDLLDGRTPDQAIMREKHREDWIRGRSQRRFVRWGMQHVATAEALGSRLSSFGILPTR
ncbi:hypothetical protein [Microbacterium sp. cf046]|uniref:hypothetical protein n=1 Tax=Microbacterium sp. cf046 TaxID=1761803 RepID=UPI0011142965|nr:hypothetical protein [Microbacterium sp. cf046]